MIITHIYHLGTSGTFYYSGIGNFLEYCQGYHRSMALVVENHVRSQEDIDFGLVLVRLSVLAGQVLPMIEMILYGIIFMTLYKANKAPLGLSAEVCQTIVKITLNWTLLFFFSFFFFFCRLSDQEIGKTWSPSLAKRLLLPSNSFAAWSFNCTSTVQAVILRLVFESTWWLLLRWFRWQWSWLLRNCDDSISINIEWISRKWR